MGIITFPRRSSGRSRSFRLKLQRPGSPPVSRAPVTRFQPRKARSVGSSPRPSRLPALVGRTQWDAFSEVARGSALILTWLIIVRYWPRWLAGIAAVVIVVIKVLMHRHSI
jgi:hypothetical protein